MTIAGGALAVVSSSQVSAPSVSTINWFASGQTLANSTIVPCATVPGDKGNANINAVKIFVVGGTAGVSKCHALIDCVGYVAGS